MAETSFTPGPWVAHDDRSWDGGDSISILDGRRWDQKGPWLASVHGKHVGPTDPDEVLANARLMAAAPEMYAALREAKEFIENQQLPDAEWSRVLDVVAYALAKAVRP